MALIRTLTISTTTFEGMKEKFDGFRKKTIRTAPSLPNCKEDHVPGPFLSTWWYGSSRVQTLSNRWRSRERSGWSTEIHSALNAFEWRFACLLPGLLDRVIIEAIQA